jgi:phage gp46-like protein
MADIKTIYTPELMGGDFKLDDFGGLETDYGLNTAVIISLFTNRRAADDDKLPHNDSGRGGWWGDGEDPIGSRLWLLNREVESTEVLNRAEEYVQEALAWMISEGVAQEVNIECWWERTGMLGIQIEIVKPDGQSLKLLFEYIWSSYAV